MHGRRLALQLTLGICGVACVAPAARHDTYTVLSAFNFKAGLKYINGSFLQVVLPGRKNLQSCSFDYYQETIKNNKILNPK